MEQLTTIDCLKQGGKPFLRQESCWRCISGHSGATECTRPGCIVKVYCERTRRMGSVKRACYCGHFESIYSDKLYYDEDGVPVRNRTSRDFRTECQWNEVGRRVKKNAIGLTMRASLYSSKTYTYYEIQDTIKK